VTRDGRAWLRRVTLALGAALVAGLLGFLVARGAWGVALFVQQQQLLSEIAGTLQGGIEALPAGDLRAARQRLEQLDADYERASVLVGALAAAIAAVVVYLRDERQAEGADRERSANER